MSALSFYRIGRWFYVRKIPIIPNIFRNIGYLLHNSYLPPSACIGKGTKLGYRGMALVIHSRAIIGQRCMIGQCVTIGASAGYVSNEKHPVPTIGDDCYIGAGSKIIGGISIGNRCTVGANAVVTKNLPDRAIAVGIPARIIGYNKESYKALRV